MASADHRGRGVLLNASIATGTTYAANPSSIFQDAKGARATVFSISSDQTVTARVYLEDPPDEKNTTMTEIQYLQESITGGALGRIEIDFGLGSRARVRIDNSSGSLATVKIWAFSVQ